MRNSECGISTIIINKQEVKLSTTITNFTRRMADEINQRSDLFNFIAAHNVFYLFGRGFKIVKYGE